MAILDQQNPQAAGQTLDPLTTEQIQSKSLDMNEWIQIAIRRRWIVIVTLLLVFTVGLLNTLSIRPIYESSSAILVTPNSGGGGDAELPLLSDLHALTEARSVDTQVEILSNPDLIDAAFQSLPGKHRLAGFGSLKSRGGTSVVITARKGTDVINITSQAYSPDTAAEFANKIAQTYVEQDLAKNNQATRQAREFVEKQLQQVRLAFHDASGALANYNKSNGIIDPNSQLSKLADTVATLKSSIESAQTDASVEKAAMSKMSSESARLPDYLQLQTALADSAEFISLRQHLDELVSQKAQLLQDYTAKSPEVTATDALIDDTTNRLKAVTTKVAASQATTLEPIKNSMTANYDAGLVALAMDDAKAKAYTTVYTKYLQQADHLPGIEQGYAQLMMNVDIQKNTVEMLAGKDQELMISEQATMPNVSILTNAQPSSAPVSPKVDLDILLSLLFGLLAGLALAALAEHVDDRVHDHEAAEKMTGLVTLGSVHEIAEDEPKVIAIDDKKSQLVERFRVLRNNIAFSSLERSVKLMAVTSTMPGEGKSTCCTNLGIAMALDDKRVLIVDCDLHRPSVHNLLNVSREVGFTNVVLGTQSLESAIMSTAYAGLDFLPAGSLPPNPSEVLNSRPSRELFKRLAGMYDMVILDCPPCAKLSDVQVISTIVDGMLLLVGMNRTLKRGLLYASRALMQVSAPLIGLVMNRVDSQQHRYGYYGYYYYYGKYDYYSYYEADAEDGTTTRKRRSRSSRKSDSTK